MACDRIHKYWPRKLQKSMVKIRACRNWHASPLMQPPVLFDSELTFANDLEPNQGTAVGESQGYVLRAGAWSMEKKMWSIKGANDDRWPNVFSHDLSRAFAIQPWDRGPEAPSTSASWPIDAVWGDDVGKAQFHWEMVAILVPHRWPDSCNCRWIGWNIVRLLWEISEACC